MRALSQRPTRQSLQAPQPARGHGGGAIHFRGAGQRHISGAGKLGEVMGGEGVALRGGHHCAQPLMSAFGVDATTRASLALYNDETDIEAFDKAITRMLKVLS